MTTLDASYYIHTIDPVIVHVAGPLAIRWYGLAYVGGFLAAYWMLMRWARANAISLSVESVQEVVFYALIGALVGGRLGYVLFYDFPAWRAEPLLIFQVWKGGMASHGGMVGFALAMYFYARCAGIPFLHLTDSLACVAPVGLFLGRVANFINGELWGRATTVRWAVVFPQEAGLYPPMPGLRAEAAELVRAGLLHPRHPSQLYEAALEGLLLLAILLYARRTAWARVHGRLSALFLLVYAPARFVVEFVREPEIVHFGWMTQGQLLSLLLVIPAVIVLRITARRDSAGRG